MTMSLRKQSTQPPVQAERKSASLDAIFADPRDTSRAWAAIRAGRAPQEDQGIVQMERRGSQPLQSGNCWWLQRNYLTVEAKLFVTDKLLCSAQLPDA